MPTKMLEVLPQRIIDSADIFFPTTTVCKKGMQITAVLSIV